MAIVDDLKAKISEGRIIFDPTQPPNKLRDELLGASSGTKVTETLQKLVLAVCELAKIRISSIVRNEGLHGQGRAFDVGNEDVAKTILPILATDAKVAALDIDEIIFDATVAGESSRNKWNYDQGSKHDFDATTLDKHRDHVHFGVKALELRSRGAAPKRPRGRRPGTTPADGLVADGAKAPRKPGGAAAKSLAAGGRVESRSTAKPRPSDEEPRAKKKAPAKKK
ncbi:hypothetical protein K2Z84_29690 [Candidatus Binatia bacterium]|nr:hypothetical protein [Candidatus Binatia bacterium]